MKLDYIKLSLQNLSRRKTRSYLTMIGIVIGIAAVIALMGLGEGLRIAISSQFSFLGTDTLTVQASGLHLAGPPGMSSVTPLTDDLSIKIAKVNGVKASINRYMKTGTLEFNDKQAIGLAMSMPSGENRKHIEKQLNIVVEEGRNLKEGDVRKVLLGNSFKDDEWGISAGDRILISDFQYEVAGIMKKKGSFMLDGAVIINEETLLNDFGDDGTVNLIAVIVNDEKEMDNVKADIEKLLRKERDVKLGDEDFAVESSQNLLDILDSSLSAVNIFIFLIAGISLLVGGIGIMNTMYTSVLERTKEIGIMKSIGAKNSTIFSLFCFESGFLGIVGGIIGIILGLILSYGFAALGRKALGVDLIQAHVSIGLILGAVLFSFFVGIIAGLIPAYQASQKNPVDSLRFAK